MGIKQDKQSKKSKIYSLNCLSCFTHILKYKMTLFFGFFLFIHILNGKYYNCNSQTVITVHTALSAFQNASCIFYGAIGTEGD